ncbi:MAG TPA: hypothetical protein PKA74_06405 [Bauldia sp.]|nr:hypothetical protein [Bauldia sp.]
MLVAKTVAPRRLRKSAESDARTAAAPQPRSTAVHPRGNPPSIAPPGVHQPRSCAGLYAFLARPGQIPNGALTACGAISPATLPVPGIAMADLAFIALALVSFALLALLLRAADRL